MIDSNNKDRNAYPLELNDFILEFLGNNVFLVFDIVEDEMAKLCIHEGGKCVKGNGIGCYGTKFACSLPLNNNVTKIILRL